MAVVKQPVHGGGGQEGIAEEGVPLGDVAVGGNDGGGLFVALADDVGQVHGLVVGERTEAEIVNDEETRAGETAEPAIVCSVGTGGAKRGEHLLGGDVQGGMASKAGTVAHGLAR